MISAVRISAFAVVLTCGWAARADLLVGSLQTDSVLRFDGSTGQPVGSGIFTSESGLTPKGIVSGPDGNIYVSNSGPDFVTRYTPSGAKIGNGIFVGLQSAGLMGPNGLVFGLDGNLYVSSEETNQVLRYDGTTGAPVGNGIFVSGFSAGLTAPSGLTFGPDGNLYVSSQPNNQVLRFNATTGAPVGNGVFVPAGSAGLQNPMGLIFGPDGSLYVASAGSNQILRYDGITGAPIGNGVFVSAGSAGLSFPVGVTYGPDGSLYVASGGSAQVLRYDSVTGAPVGNGVFVAAGSVGLHSPSYLIFPTLGDAVPEPGSGFTVRHGLGGIVPMRWEASPMQSSASSAGQAQGLSLSKTVESQLTRGPNGCFDVFPRQRYTGGQSDLSVASGQLSSRPRVQIAGNVLPSVTWLRNPSRIRQSTN